MKSLSLISAFETERSAFCPEQNVHESPTLTARLDLSVVNVYSFNPPLSYERRSDAVRGRCLKLSTEIAHSEDMVKSFVYKRTFS